ncbi:unnamed protein product [Debaryomyces tyrocola]|nr:unnamed protein product [Debaryomyces tyrocola]
MVNQQLRTRSTLLLPLTLTLN